MADRIPALLKSLTGRAGLTLAQAMKAAKVLVPKHASEAALAQLAADDLVRLGLDDGVAKKIANTLGKGLAAAPVKGVKGKGKRKASAEDEGAEGGDVSGSTPAAAADASGSSSKAPAPVKKRTKRVARDMFEVAVEGMDDLGTSEKAYLPLDFGADLSIQALLKHEVRINRAPIMTAWALVVCRRLGFDEKESLSLAHSFTDLNASSKAVSLGIKPKPSERKAREAELSTRAGEGWQQPHVVLMGRNPVMTLPAAEADPDDPSPPAESTYRALSGEHSTPVAPALAARYIHSSLAASGPFVLRAMTLVAESWTAEELQGRKGWEIYIALRPEVEGWGKKGVVRIESILALSREAEIEGKVKEELKDSVKGEDEYDDDKFWSTFDFDEADLLDDSIGAAQAVVD